MAWTVTNTTTSDDLTADVDATSMTLAQRAYAETSRLSITVSNEAGTHSIANEDEIVLMDGALKAFAGYVRNRTRSDRGVSTQLRCQLELQDYTTALGDDVCDTTTAVRANGESDKARIAALGAAFGTRGIVYSGTTIVQIRAAMPDQDFTGLTMHEALTLICSVTGGSFYVDYDKVLHYFASEAISAPFGLSDNPNGSTTFGYEQFALSDDTTGFVNAVFVIGTNFSGWRYLGGSPPAAGTRRAITIRDETVVDATTLNNVGDAAIAQYGQVRQPSSLVTYRAGLRAGMTVQVTHGGYGLSAVSYRIASIEARPVDANRIAYTVFFGSNPVSLGEIMRDTNLAVAQASAAAQTALAQVTDLSVGGGNLVPNSSFEDGSIWTVGSSWAIGVAAADAFHGADEAKYTPSASSARLSTGFITVDRTDSYFVSAWIFCRAFTSGRLQFFVEEYNAANTLLATTVIASIAAVDTGYKRYSRRFTTAPGVGVTAWQTTTAKIKIVFGPNGVNATGTWSVDGVQLERGEVLTAYAPAPQEIVAGSIGTTQIADNAITSPKLIAGAVVAGKVAAGSISATELAAGSVTTGKLDTGNITLFDQFGQTILSPAGFGPTWVRFIEDRIFNSDFHLQPTSFGSGNPWNDATNPLPFWHYVQTGTAIKGYTNISGAQPAIVAAGTGLATDDTYIEQTVSVQKTFAANGYLQYRVAAYVMRTASALTGYLDAAWLDSGLSVISSDQVTAKAGTNVPELLVAGGLGAIPSNAAYLRIRVGLKRGAAGTSVTDTFGIARVWISAEAAPDTVRMTLELARLGSVQSIPDATQTAIVFDSAVFGGNGPLAKAWSSSTNPSRFTVPEGYAGLWEFAGGVTWASTLSSTADPWVSIRRTNITGGPSSAHIGLQTALRRGFVSSFVYLNEGDYVELLCNQGSGAAVNALAGADYSMYLRAVYLGPVVDFSQDT